MQIFNDICFEDFLSIINNIQTMSETGDTISTESGHYPWLFYQIGR